MVLLFVGLLVVRSVLCYDDVAEVNMSVIPIQVTAEGVLIPKMYLDDASDVEVVVGEDYVLVRPRLATQTQSGERRSGHRYSFIGIAHTRNPRASVEAEEILEREVNRRVGWERPE